MSLFDLEAFGWHVNRDVGSNNRTAYYIVYTAFLPHGWLSMPPLQNATQGFCTQERVAGECCRATAILLLLPGISESARAAKRSLQQHRVAATSVAVSMHAVLPVLELMVHFEQNASTCWSAW
jgi:hypothetical protein